MNTWRTAPVWTIESGGGICSESNRELSRTFAKDLEDEPNDAHQAFG
jgi:hypothetical protein